MTRNITFFPIKPFLALIIVAVWSATAGGAELVIIGNENLSVPHLETKTLQRIYMGKQTRWSNDEPIVPVMLSAGPTHETFVESYLDRSAHRFVTYWRQMVFTGKGLPPRTFATETELVAFVARTPGALGYASAAAQTSGVKILTVADR